MRQRLQRRLFVNNSESRANVQGRYSRVIIVSLTTLYPRATARRLAIRIVTSRIIVIVPTTRVTRLAIRRGHVATSQSRIHRTPTFQDCGITILIYMAVFSRPILRSVLRKARPTSHASVIANYKVDLPLVVRANVCRLLYVINVLIHEYLSVNVSLNFRRFHDLVRLKLANHGHAVYNVSLLNSVHRVLHNRLTRSHRV